MSGPGRWSVMAGTSWLLVEAASEDQAKLRALTRLGFTRRIFDRSAPSGHRVAPTHKGLLDYVTARPASDEDMEAWDDLVAAVTAKGGRSGRLAMVAASKDAL